MKAYNKGLVTEETIRQAAIRLFTTRFLLGMFDETEYDGLNYLDVETKEHIAVAKRASDESIVLLKNDGILPLDKDKNQVIAVIGPNADSRRPLIGNYYGTSSEYITAIEGIREAAGENTRILYSEGCDLSRKKPDPLSREYNCIAEAEAVMDRSDLVILVIGLNETLEGEEGDEGNHYASGDKPDLAFPKPQQKLIDTVIKSGKPFITVVMTGSAMDLTLLSEHSSAIMQAWYPGARGGRSIGDIIFGKVNPSGKLPVTFYRNTDDLPDFEDYSMKVRTYRFIETEPLYPFGYGLTYSDVSIDEARIEGYRTSGAKISVTVRNDSSMTAAEVVQVYAKSDDIDEVRNGKLAGFARVTCEAGKSVDIVIDIPSENLRVVRQDGSRVLPEGEIKLYVGFGQPDARTEALTGKKSAVLTI
jgi:beta-glucosidase